MHGQIIERARALIEIEVNSRRRLAVLEEKTGIPAVNWKNVWNRKQRPTAMMIQALCLSWPNYAFWLVTGITNQEKGHSSPNDADTIDAANWGDTLKIAANKIQDEKIAAVSSVLKDLKSTRDVMVL